MFASLSFFNDGVAFPESSFVVQLVKSSEDHLESFDDSFLSQWRLGEHSFVRFANRCSKRKIILFFSLGAFVSGGDMESH